VTVAPDGLPPLREVIRRYGLFAKKSLGQNFLLDLNLTVRIARAAGDLSAVTVLEIGSGPGGLTRALLTLGAARVIAVERDARAIAALEEIAGHYAGRLEIVAADALAFDARPYLDRGPVRIVANLPYNIATALLVSWVTLEPWPPWYEAAVLMFQREVAERIVAAPGSKSYGRLSVLVQCVSVCPSAKDHLVAGSPRAADRAASLRSQAARSRNPGRIWAAAQNAASKPALARC
jgi:16S rRNA (adenine1518-N6/adenine1519-N6)-dimethyltransferase